MQVDPNSGVMLRRNTGTAPPEIPAVDGVDDALRSAIALDSGLVPGFGRTAELWELLATLAARDLAVARAVEPHLDARAILTQAGHGIQNDTTWGVFAAEGSASPLTATESNGSWTLTGTKSWCSLADRLDRALVTAHVPGGRRLFAIDLRQSGVIVRSDAWHARGLIEIPSGPVDFDVATAEPVGDTGWYLDRPGFAWGGMAVAACWFGGAIGIARTVLAAIPDDADPLRLMHLGVIDEHIENARRALADAAALVDLGAGHSLTAKRVRATVSTSVERILERAAHALGPAPLALDANHAKRVADLQLYVRQHHAERDQASLGRSLLQSRTQPW